MYVEWEGDRTLVVEMVYGKMPAFSSRVSYWPDGLVRNQPASRGHLAVHQFHNKDD